MKKFSSLFYTGLTILLVPSMVIFILSIAAILHHNPSTSTIIETVAEVESPKTVIIRDTVFITPEEVIPPQKKKPVVDSIPKRIIFADTVIQRKDTI